MLTSRQQLRTLGRADLPAFLRLAEQDPVVNVFADYRARTTNLEPRWLGGEMWGRFSDGELTAACHVGANLVPVQCTPQDAEAFAARLLKLGRLTTTIVGPEEPVEAFWQAVSHRWIRPREIRRGQPHLVIQRSPDIDPDPAVIASTTAHLDAVYPACVAMYTEEVGVSPEINGGADLYRTRVRQLISRGWSFARFEEGRVVFKAEVACVTPAAAQVQGVWVPPDRRGEGLATRGMAAVVRAVRRDIAPVVSLYVNDFNEAARRAYERVGFVETARFTTVMF
ncbi:MAG: GNAT family N-acetyltransferase [Nocardioides sp.]|uniref:GNAT family N-acetyltransferase n=1 Tax=Nocardioides sp. TaxID=35761 RepID=UPI0039E72111